MQDELVDYVDENDRVIGQALRSEIKAQRLGAVRVSSVLIFTSKGDLVLGKMALRKGEGANLLTFTASGHAMAGESSEEAAVRELYEEQGVQLNLQDLFFQAKIISYYDGDITKPKRIRSIYTACCDEVLKPNKEEYQYNVFFSELTFKERVKKAPKIFSSSFLFGLKEMKRIPKKETQQGSLSCASEKKPTSSAVLSSVFLKGKEL